MDFEARIGEKDYLILKSVYKNYQPPDPKSDDFLALLHALYALEYRNSELWYDLHPIVSKMLIHKGIIEP